MYHRVAVVLCAGFALGACTSAPVKPEEFVRFYNGSLLPISELAVLKSADLPVSSSGQKAPVRVELMAIDKRRFPRDGGLGNGTFEVHLLPGTYTLQLKYSPAPGAGSSSAPVDSKKLMPFTFTAQAGHTYVLSGEYLRDAEEQDAQWRPVMLDRTRKLAWSRREAQELADRR